jgi:UDP-glucose 4-epimerase
VRVLLTGHRGMIGQAVGARLRADGHDVVGLDRSRRHDVGKLALVRRRACGCDVVVHAAAIANNRDGTPDEIMRVNVLGTHNVLTAAEEIGARVVYLSSVQALGVLEEGGDPPRYVPVDDDYPPHPQLAYGVSKLAGEELCAAFTRRTGLTSICLRPVGVWDGARVAQVAARRFGTDTRWERRWELGVFVDLRDCVDAVVLSLTAEVTGHVRLLVAADDSALPRPPLEMLARVHPGVAVRDAARFEDEPFRSLVDSSRATEVLGWEPAHRWTELKQVGVPR